MNITDEIKDKIKLLYCEGNQPKKISELVNLPIQTIWGYLNRIGLIIKRKLPIEIRKEIGEKYKNGLTFKKLAQEYGKTEGVIRSIIRNLGIATIRRPSITPKERKEIGIKIREEAKKNNICINCLKRPTRPSKLTCEECASAKKRSYHKKKKVGNCLNCNSIIFSRVYCETCRNILNKKRKERRQQDIQNKKCVNGDGQTAEINQFCTDCWFKDKARNHLNNYKDFQQLKDLLILQNYKCSLSRETLIPGINASVDHKIPISRGGKNELLNLQWVTKDINSAKHNLTNEEFIKLCASVTQRG